MKVLFVHNNFPAQFRHVVRALLTKENAEVAAICSARAVVPPFIRTERYEPPTSVSSHIFARRFDSECQRAEQIIYAAMRLKRQGFVPDIVVAHSGWGETLPLREIYPGARIVVYCEFYYRSRGQDVGFDSEFPEFGIDGRVAVHVKNAAQLLALADADIGVSPTQWQRATYPIELQPKIAVVHEGVNTRVARPEPRAVFPVRADLALTAADEVITFVSRNLEPLRGIHQFLRALPALLAERPKAHVVIAGGEGVSYGPQVTPPFTSWRERFWTEVAPSIDRSRVHFTGALPYARYLALLQVSKAHVYLTYPFVLSWSLLEAMSTGCAIVASDTPPVAEVITPELGRLVPFFDASALSSATAATLAEHARLTGQRQRAREKIVSTYDAETVCCPQFLHLLRQL